MTPLISVLGAAAITLIAALPAHAQEQETAAPHPADVTITYQTPVPGDPFAFAIPLATREMPAPSYQQRQAVTEEAPAMDHSMMPGMDHSAMPGMDHGSDGAAP